MASDLGKKPNLQSKAQNLTILFTYLGWDMNQLQENFILQSNNRNKRNILVAKEYMVTVLTSCCSSKQTTPLSREGKTTF